MLLVTLGGSVRRSLTLWPGKTGASALDSRREEFIMVRRLRSVGLFLTLLSLTVVLAAGAANATEVWSGRTYVFSKAANANPSLAANQDRIVTNVWITRASTQGIYNAALELGYDSNSGTSPLDTEWADGDAVNHGSLTFLPWVSWANNNPPSKLGVNACVHLIAENIFIDIRFTSWAAGGAGGGAFSYIRAVQPLATPVRPGTWGAIKALYR
jgi:hypothetical protein